MRLGAGASALARMFAAALAAAVAGYAAQRALTALHPLFEAGIVAAVFGAVYLAAAAALKLEQAGALLQRLRRRRS